MNNEKLIFALDLIANLRLPSELTDDENCDYDWESECAHNIALARDALAGTLFVPPSNENLTEREKEFLNSLFSPSNETSYWVCFKHEGKVAIFLETLGLIEFEEGWGPENDFCEFKARLTNVGNRFVADSRWS